jgi:diguanylate cyclase (GGDEF)-like protein/PAS domain S-box-containing protein
MDPEMNATSNHGSSTDHLPDITWCESFATSNSPDVIVLADPELCVMWANDAAGRLLGHDPLAFRGRPVVDFVHAEDVPHAVGAISEASRGDGYHIATRLRLLHTTGDYIDCRVTANTVDAADGVWFVLGVRAVGDEDAIESRRRRLRGLATTFYVDCASMEWVDEPTRATALLSGLGAVLDAESVEVAELAATGKSLHTVAAWQAGQLAIPGSVGRTETVSDLEHLRSVPCEYVFDGGEHRVRIWLESSTGNDGVVTIDLADHPEQWDDANADIVSLMCSSLLATVRRCSRERALAMAATRDPLTGLLNRSAMQERLEELISVSQLDGDALAVFFADLNNFKALNDTEGHQAGDEVLKSVAGALRRAIRPGDLAARVGGDEFVVVMMTRRRSLERLTERLRTSVESALLRTPGVGVAIGAITVRDGESPDEVLERADVAMYADKRHMANSGVHSDPGRSDPGPRLSIAMEALSILLAVDSEARLLSATQAAYSVFGFDRDTSTGMDVLQLVHREDRSFASAAFNHVIRDPEAKEPIDVRVIDAGGQCHHVQIGANNQLANPDIRGVVLTLTEKAVFDPPGPGRGSDRDDRPAR